MASLTEAADAGMHVDQVGYLTGYEKVAMVTDSGDTDFSVVDAKTGKVVYTGKLSAAKADPMSEETLRRADFTGLKTPGTYKLKVGNRESYDFAIGDNVYAVPAVQTWRSYTLTRSGTPIDDADITGLKVKNGHAQDKEAKVYFTDKLNKKGDKVDVTGGWYDAGDYGKYTTTAGIAAAELLLAYEAHPDHFTKGQLLFPKGIKYDKNLPDALNEVKYEFDFMKKMMRKDGSTFHKVSGVQWPGFDKSPDTDTQERFLYSTCSASTAMYGASLAIGGRVYKDFDPAYAKSLLKDADKVWGYLAKAKESVYRVDEGQESGSGPYNDTNDIQERLWMAAEMFRTTGDKKYEDYLKGRGREQMTTKTVIYGWGNTQALAQYAYLKSEHADPEFRKEVLAAFIQSADEIVQQIKQDGLRCSLHDWDFYWASTKVAVTNGDLLLLANEFAPNLDYVSCALDQVH